MNANLVRRFASVLRSCPRYTHSQAADSIFRDPKRPELFYHLVNPPTPLSPASNVFAVSFLDQPLHNAESSAILGWVPAPDAKSSLSSEEVAKRVTWRNFRENGESQVLTLVRRGGIVICCDVSHIQGRPSQEYLRDFARRERRCLGEFGEVFAGWVDAHSRSVSRSTVSTPFSKTSGNAETGVVDQRNPPALSRIGDPDDIIASVLVENSRIQPDTYQPMPSYRVCTADGVLQLTPAMLQDLVQALERVVERENASVNP